MVFDAATVTVIFETATLTESSQIKSNCHKIITGQFVVVIGPIVA
jgi:hypothetical protein